MYIIDRFLIVAFILSVFLLTSCVDSDNTRDNSNPNTNSNSTQPKKTANDNAEELGMLIKLPFEPVEAVWLEEPAVQETGRVPGPNDRRLRAVLLFSQKDTEKIVAEAAKGEGPVPVEVMAEDWYPTELISKSEMAEDQKLKGSRLAADQFFQSPYLEGSVIQIEGTDYFVVELFTR